MAATYLNLIDKRKIILSSEKAEELLSLPLDPFNAVKLNNS